MSQECQRFVEWQRQFFAKADDTASLRSRYERAMQRLLALGRMLNAATSDPAFMDRRAADVVKARLGQSKESRALSHTAMTAIEAEALLAEHFKA